jgi:hypothetical protein
MGILLCFACCGNPEVPGAASAFVLHALEAIAHIQNIRGNIHKKHLLKLCGRLTGSIYGLLSEWLGIYTPHSMDNHKANLTKLYHNQLPGGCSWVDRCYPSVGWKCLACYQDKGFKGAHQFHTKSSESFGKHYKSQHGKGDAWGQVIKNKNNKISPLIAEECIMVTVKTGLSTEGNNKFQPMNFAVTVPKSIPLPVVTGRTPAQRNSAQFGPIDWAADFYAELMADVTPEDDTPDSPPNFWKYSDVWECLGISSHEAPQYNHLLLSVPPDKPRSLGLESSTAERVAEIILWNIRRQLDEFRDESANFLRHANPSLSRKYFPSQ